MAIDLKGYRVFIASPGGLEGERKAFQRTLIEYNESDANERGVAFLPQGWEMLPGGLGRPQGKINEQICQCDYFILILWDRWGTPPSADTGCKFTSGTEEEYHVALNAIETSDMPMRKIVIFFKAVDNRQLSDPGPQLQKVLNFKKMLETEKKLLYTNFDETHIFEHSIRKHLAQWVRDHEDGKLKKEKDESNPMPPFDKPSDVLPVQASLSIEVEIAPLLQHAYDLATEGHFTEAEAIYAQLVTADCHPTAYIEYGKFLAKQGSYEKALQMYLKSFNNSIGIHDDAAALMAASEMANCLYSIGNNADAASWYTMVLAMMQVHGVINSERGVRTLYNVCKLYLTIGDYKKAHETILYAKEIADAVLNDTDPLFDRLKQLESDAANTINCERAHDVAVQLTTIATELGGIDRLISFFQANPYTVNTARQIALRLGKEISDINKEIDFLEQKKFIQKLSYPGSDMYRYIPHRSTPLLGERGEGAPG